MLVQIHQHWLLPSCKSFDWPNAAGQRTRLRPPPLILLSVSINHNHKTAPTARLPWTHNKTHSRQQRYRWGWNYINRANQKAPYAFVAKSLWLLQWLICPFDVRAGRVVVAALVVELKPPHEKRGHINIYPKASSSRVAGYQQSVVVLSTRKLADHMSLCNDRSP